MSPAELDPTETVIRFSRRQLWALLGFMVEPNDNEIVDKTRGHGDCGGGR